MYSSIFLQNTALSEIISTVLDCAILIMVLYESMQNFPW